MNKAVHTVKSNVEDICFKRYVEQRDSAYSLLLKHFFKMNSLNGDSAVVFADDDGIGLHIWSSSDDSRSFTIKSIFNYKSDKFPLLKMQEVKLVVNYNDMIDSLYLINPNCPLFVYFDSCCEIPDSVKAISFERSIDFFCQSPEIAILTYWDRQEKVKIMSKSGYEYTWEIPLHAQPPVLLESKKIK